MGRKHSLSGATIKSGGATIRIPPKLARGNAAAAYERGLKERTLIIEFPSLEKATAAHDSPAYQEALKALGDGQSPVATSMDIVR